MINRVQVSRITLIVLSILFTTSCGWIGNLKVRGNSSLQSGTPGGTGSISSEAVNPPNGVELSSPQPAVADRCWPLTIVSTYNGTASPVSSPTTVTLALPGGVLAYSTYNCASGSETTTATIPTGSTSTIVWVKSSVPGVYVIGSSGPGFPGGTTTITFNNNNDGSVPVRMAINGPNSTAAEGCTAYTATFYGSDNNYAVFKTAANLLLSSSDTGLNFYSNSGCTGNSINAITLPANTPSLAFYLKTSSTGLKSLYATANALQGQLVLLVLPQSASKTLIQGPTLLNGNQCGVFTVNIVDSLGNLVTTPVQTNVSLTRTGEGLFYSDPSCSNSVTSLPIPAGNSGAFFYYKGTIASTNVITSAVSGLANGTFTLVVNSAGSSGPAKLAFELGALATPAGNCLGPIKVQIQDVNSVTLAGVSSRPVNLTETGNGKFFSDSTCQNNINATNTNTDFYFQDIVAENIVLYADDPSASLAAAFKNLTITAGAKYQLVVLGSFAPFVAGSCQPLDVFFADPFFNAVSSNSASPVSLKEVYPTSGKFYSDTCTTTLPNSSDVYAATIPANLLKQRVYFKETVAGLGRLKAYDNVVKEGSFDFQVIAGAASKLVLENPPTSGGTNSCIGPMKFILLDAFDNKAVASSAVNFNLAANLGSFYTSGCATSQSSWQIPAGQGTVSAYFMTPTAGTVNGTATPTSTPPSGTSFNLDIDGVTIATRVAVVGKSPLSLRGPATSMVGVCLPFAFKTETSQGTAAPLASATFFKVTSTSPSAVSYFSNASCTTALNWPVSSDGAETLFYVKASTATSLTFFGTGGGLASLGYDIDFNPAALSTISVSGPSSTLAGVCEGPYTIQGKDVNGNVTPIPNGTSFSLTGASQGFFHKAAGCSDVGTSATSVTVNSPAVSTAFYYKNTKVETVSLNANSTLGSGYQNVAVNAGAPTAIVLTGPSSTMKDTCSGPLQFSLRDANGNLVITNASRLFSLSQTGSIGFFSANCTSSISEIDIPANQALSQSFAFKSSTAQTAVMTLSGLSSSVAGLNIQQALTISQPIVPPTADLKVNGQDAYYMAQNYSNINLTWTSTNATSCEISNVTGESNSPSGSFTYKVSASLTYVLTCTGAGGTATDYVAVPLNGGWFRTDNRRCDDVCRENFRVSAVSVEGHKCASGENRPASALGNISYTYGCWNVPCTDVNSSHHLTSDWFDGYCYATSLAGGGSQVHDGDSTDRTMGCYCEGIPAVPGNPPTTPGLNAKYYVRSGQTNIVGFNPDSATAVSTGVISNLYFGNNTAYINIEPPGLSGIGRTPPDRFVISIRGYLKVPESKNYHFEVFSDDGSRIWIGDKQILNDEYEHSVATKDAGTYYLVEGYYPFRMDFFNSIGTYVMMLKWNGTVIPASQFFR